MDAAVARANPELATVNARSLGMGGVGTSLVGDGAAIFHNPAGLDDVQRLTLTASITPVLASTRAPWAGPGSESRSDLLFGPLFDLGAGIRLNPWLVVGLGAYTSNGFGNTFSDVPALDGADVEVAALSGELSAPVVARLAPGLSVGFAPRLAFSRVTSSTLAAQADPAAEPAFVRSRASMWGVSPLGFQLGVRYRLLPPLRIGVNYRSAMSIDLSGTTRVDGMRFDAESEYAIPHSFRFGFDLTLLAQRLIVALDGRYMLYDISHRNLTTTLASDGMRMSTTVPLNWRNVLGLMCGLEFLVVPTVPIRLGYVFSPSATPAATASAFVPIPATSHAISAGVGVRPDHYDIDFGALYSMASVEVASGPTAGSYENQSAIFSLSVSYHR